MNTFTDLVYQHGMEVLGGSSLTLLIAAVVRHRPEWQTRLRDWPKAIYYWFFDSAQEVVSQRTGAPPPPRPPVAPPVQQEPEANPTQQPAKE